MTLPTPYYQDDAVMIYHGDCRELLPLMPKVDLVLTDPPYGVTLQNHRTANNRRRDREWAITGDESTAIGNRVLYELRRLPIIAFACPEKPWGAGVPWKQHLVWDKGGAVGGGGDPATYWKRTWELLQVANTSRLNGPRDNAVLRYFMTPQDSSEHPAAKPVELLRYLIVKATNSNDTILDPFMGSGTTLVAAQSLGRKSIGIEIEERYCQIAVERLRQKPLPLEYTTSHDIIRPEQGGLFHGSPANGRDQAQDFDSEQGAQAVGRSTEATE